MTFPLPKCAVGAVILIVYMSGVVAFGCQGEAPGSRRARVSPSVSPVADTVTVVDGTVASAVELPLGTNSATPTAPSRGPTWAPLPSVDDRPISVHSVRPWFDEPPLAQALSLFHGGKNNQAAALFEAFVEASPEDPRAPPARFLGLLARHDGGVFSPTAAGLEAVAGQWPEIADYAWFYAGSAHRHGGRFQRSIAALERVGSEALLWARAQELAAEAEVAAGRPEAARERLKRMLATRPRSRASAWQSLRKLELDGGDRAAARAADLAVATRFARRPEGRAALKRLVAASRRAREPYVMTSEARFDLGRALHQAQRHDEAIAQLSHVAATSPRWCEANYLLGRTWEKKKKRARAWTHYASSLEAACKVDRGLYAKATFSGGRNRLKEGATEDGLALLQAHLDAFPERSTVDDVLVMMAAAKRDAGDAEAAGALLMRAVREHPDGDQIDDAAWQLVWAHLKAGDEAGALAAIQTIAPLVPRETHYRAEGRLGYWHARLVERGGEGDRAEVLYHSVIEEHALSWYALLAYARLAARDALKTAAWLKTMEAKAAATDVPADDPLAQIPLRLWRSSRFRTAVALLRLGLIQSAAKELARVKGTTDAAAWNEAVLFQAAGSMHRAMRLARPREPALGAHWPTGWRVALWRIAHARPWADLVTQAAADYDIDPYWVWSIMREESGFNPTVESWANAVGLMQIILPTAEYLARGTDIAPTRASLQQPKNAIALGAKYLGRLLAKQGRETLATPGYNAGGGAVSRWRREFGELELDLFVETIPFKEARGYTKRVIRSLARYRWLYEGELLRLDLSPPGPPG